MNRFKVKLNGVEMRMIGITAVNAARDHGAANCAMDLVVMDSLERIWSRLRNMYRPDKDRYTVQFSSVEAFVMTDWIVPTLLATDDPMPQSLGMRLEQELFNQINRECNIYNAMNYGR